MNVELIIVRHGETELNRIGSFQGQIDAPLNENGLAQARRLAHRLAGEQFDAVHCSDLQRAVQTAEPVARALGLTARRDRGLREQHFGELDGMSLARVQSEFPQLWQAWLRHDADFALPGGESVRRFSERVLETVIGLGRETGACRHLVVCHGGVLDMLYRHANRHSLHGPRVCSIPNTGINRFELRNDQLRIRVWADDAHLSVG